MFRTHSTTRVLIAASLVVTLGLTGLFPQMLAWVDNGARVAADDSSGDDSSGDCCCGTADGFC